LEPVYVDALDADGVATAARQTHALWGGGRSLEDHLGDTFEQLARSSGLLRFVGLYEGSTLLCSLKRYDAVLNGPNGATRAVGIGALFTPETLRRRGYAQRLLQIVMHEAQRASYGAAVLYSDIDPRFYERLGYVLLPHPIWTAAAASLPRDGALSAAPCDDVGRLLAIYDASFAPGWVRMLRSEASWRLAAWRQRSAQTLLLSDQEREVGYLTVSTHEDLLWVVDEALIDTQVDRLWATLRALAEARGAARVAGWLRADHAAGPFAAQPRSCCVPMVAPLDARLAGIGALPTHLAAFDHF
jgi:hypothetical protein